MTTKQERLDIANTILEQLSPGGMDGLRDAIGATYFAATQSGVQFRFKGNRTMNLVQITRNYTDNYDLAFLNNRKVTGRKRKTVDQRKDVYGDQLRDVFERVTGLLTGF